MKKKIRYLILLPLFCCLSACEQVTPDAELVENNKLVENNNKFVNDTTGLDSRNYLFSSLSMPYCYSLDKVSKLIPEKEHFKPTKISETDFESLNAYEHFIHSFYFPEWYYQSCSMFGDPQNILQKIPSLLKRQGEGFKMSERQRNAIIENRDSTVLLMKTCIEKASVIHDEFKRHIVSLKAFELIPTLIDKVESQQEIKDPYILTTLCLLMRFDYEPFRESEIYKSLYPSDSTGYYFSREAYKNSIPFTHVNYKLIKDYAVDYFELKSNELSDFVKIDEGTYSIGEKGHSTNPKREVVVQQFEISRYEITNEKFKQFVEATGYVTLAERNKDSFVFRLGLDEFEWTQDSTANWRFPNGVAYGGIEDKMNHPVTCISFIDAEAYCKWANLRLPTIEEWEIASIKEGIDRRYYFGDSLDVIYEHANIWHGKTHLMKDEKEDHLTTSPVGSFKSNPIGLFDIYGNVFEFCSNLPSSFNIYENIAATRGGSWWCSMYACGFFNSIDIGRVQKEATFSNNGFRVVR